MPPRRVGWKAIFGKSGDKLGNDSRRKLFVRWASLATESARMWSPSRSERVLTPSWLMPRIKAYCTSCRMGAGVTRVYVECYQAT
jgi:hypothetical protein